MSPDRSATLDSLGSLQGVRSPLMLIQRLRGKLQAFHDARAVARYAHDQNVLRFVVKTLKELPQQSPTGPRRLVLFAHFDPQDRVDPYVRFYLESLHHAGSTILFVSSSPQLHPDSAATIAPFCAGIYTRKTLSMDFGSWHLAWALLLQKGWSLDHFDELLLANDSVYGPLFPLEESFAAFRAVTPPPDLCGTAESLEYTPHLQSFFLLWNLNPQTRAFLQQFWQDFRYILDKDELIQAYEVGLSRMARQHGLTLHALVSDQAVQQALHAHGQAPHLPTEPLNSTLHFWELLITQFRSPFLKTAVVRRNAYNSPTVRTLPAFLRQWTSYDPALIENNLTRLGLSLTATGAPTSEDDPDSTQDAAG